MSNKKTDLISDRYNKIFGVSDSYQAPEKIMKILYNKEEREQLFKDLLELHDYNVDFDWFFEYFQEEHADRCIPFLLLNMMIRGMNGVVIHGDCLTRKCKNAYFICNQENDHLKFSGITNIPHTEEFEKELKVKFESPEYTEHKELMNIELVGKLVKGTDERDFTGSSEEIN